MNDPQLTKADLDRLYAERRYEDIEAARLSGRMNVLLGGTAPLDPGKRIERSDVSRLFTDRRYDEIEGLRSAGRLDHLLDPTTTTTEA